MRRSRPCSVCSWAVGLLLPLCPQMLQPQSLVAPWEPLCPPLRRALAEELSGFCRDVLTSSLVARQLARLVPSSPGLLRVEHLLFSTAQIHKWCVTQCEGIREARKGRASEMEAGGPRGQSGLGLPALPPASLPPPLRAPSPSPVRWGYSHLPPVIK